jgi:hypothetical protein
LALHFGRLCHLDRREHLRAAVRAHASGRVRLPACAGHACARAFARCLRARARTSAALSGGTPSRHLSAPSALACTADGGLAVHSAAGALPAGCAQVALFIGSTRRRRGDRCTVWLDRCPCCVQAA